MIFVRNTPNNAGAAIFGDFADFEGLYEALHTVVGEEDEFVAYDAARLMVLSVCYDIRHALMGDREFEFVDNGLDEEKKRRSSTIAPDKNVYFKMNVLWPQILFVVMALNEFVELYARKRTKNRYSINPYTAEKTVWDISVAQVRMLQAAVLTCLQETIPEGAFIRMRKIMNRNSLSCDHYATQYIELLDYKFIKMGKEKRLKNISIFAKRIAESGREYRDLLFQLKEEAKEQDCGVDDLQLALDFPDEFEW